MLLLLLIQAAAPAPDIALNVEVTARDVRIERSGATSLEMRAEPDGGSEVRVDKPEARGQRRLRNVRVSVRAEARIADPRQIRTEAETPGPQ